MDLVCVGDVMLDIRVDAEMLKRGGDVHGRVLLQPGGTSANASVWARWAGATAAVLGRVGDDLQGRTLRQALVEQGVEPSLTIDAEAPTGTMLVVHEPGERSMVADRGANARLEPEDLPASIEAGAVLVSGYLLLQEPGHEAAGAALERASAEFVAVEAASWPLVEGFGATRFFEATSGASAVLANELEAEVLTGRRGGEAARALGERYRVAAVKMDRRGAVLCVEGTVFSAPAEPVVEVDPTGAGDAFDGVLLASLARGAPGADALASACRAGALVASSAGAWPPKLTHDG
ncbi:MAG: carbohydrate kinase family protein [Actinomycetota bacterium]